MKETIRHCKICGDVKLENIYSGGEDGEIEIFPTEFFPTELSLAKGYKKIFGETYEQQTGNKFKGAFEKRIEELNHECPDNVGLEELKKHSIGFMECWVEIY